MVSSSQHLEISSGRASRGLFLLLLLFLLSLLPPPDLAALNLERLSDSPLSNLELLDVEYDNGFIAIPAGLGGTVIVDVSDPSNPTQVASHLDSQCRFGRYYNTYLGLSDYSPLGDGILIGAGRDCPLTILSVDESHNIEFLSNYQTGEFSYEDVAKRDSVLVLAAHADGIEIVNVSNALVPLPMGRLALDNAWAVRIEGNYVYVADGGSGLTVVDISDPYNPSVAGRVQTEGSAKDVRVRNGYAFLALGDPGVAMIDVTDPTSPFLVDVYNTTGLAAHIGVNDSVVAVADWDDVEILRYSSGNSLERAGYKNTGGRIMGVDMYENTVYVADWRKLVTYRFGEIAGADIDVDLTDINFPRTQIGESRDTTFVITSNGLSTLTVDSIRVSNSDFAIEYARPADLAPGEVLPVTITYTPTTDALGFQIISIYSNDTDDPRIRLDLLGNNLNLNVGDPAPEFTLPVLDAGDVTLSELRGRVVVLSFFASW